jgi:putative membrane protein
MSVQRAAAPGSNPRPAAVNGHAPPFNPVKRITTMSSSPLTPAPASRSSPRSARPARIPRISLRLAAIAVCAGWFAEQMGASCGWFFGDYDYTDVLGPRLGQVPLVIPLMWFALSYTGYVMANLIVWQTPVDAAAGTKRALAMAFLAALIVTAYDLGVDPYMVYKLGAWIMDKKDGWWFGETLQGFAGWMLAAFAIVSAFRLSSARALRAAAAANAGARPALRHVALPLLLYGGLMVYEVTQGVPVETRTIALFVMGISLFCAACGLARWHGERAAAPRGEPA